MRYGPIRTKRRVRLTRNGCLRKLAQIERDVLAHALKHCNGWTGNAARFLGISRSTMYRKVRIYELETLCRTINHDAA